VLAVVYLILLVLLGDEICRRFFTFISVPHRFASAFITGMLVSSWFTYLSAALFSGTSSPMVWGNVVFFVASIAAIYLLNRRPAAADVAGIDPETKGFGGWDWMFLAFFAVLACWLMFGTFAVNNGKVHIAHHQWSDFGSTVSIMQSFAEGHNFPTQYPHFTGDRIRYHFLFYFQAGNLQYLGLNPALSNNILSVLSMLSMLILVMTLGAIAFGSRAVGRIGALLFFFHGTLSFIPFLYSQGSVSNAITTILKMRDFLPSGFTYRGELWGVWSQVVFANQRHFASSIAILLLVMIFLIMRYKAVPPKVKPVVIPLTPEPIDESVKDSTSDEELESSAETLESAPAEEASEISEAMESGPRDDVQELAVVEEQPEPDSEDTVSTAVEDAETTGTIDEHVPDGGLDESVEDVAPAFIEPRRPWYDGLAAALPPFVFCGVLLGLLPMWNGAVFTAAFAVLAFLFVLFPLRREMVVLGLVTAVVALPQIYFLKSGDIPPAPPLMQWGYTLGNASYFDAVYYLGWTFGVKWLLILIAVITGTWLRNRLLIAISALIAVTFYFQFSPEALTNHKFLNIWLVIANLFAAAGVWWLWNLRTLKSVIPGRIAAGILTAVIVIGGTIDLFPFRNAMWMYMDYEDDRLIRWVKESTDPRAIFLTNRVVNNGILLAGRRLFNGHTYYAWSAGYATGPRDAVYKRMYESRDANEVLSLLKKHNISYVAYDNAIRKGDFIKNANEDVYKAYFEPVFEDTENKYDALTIYVVPDQLGPPRNSELAAAIAASIPAGQTTPATSMFTGGKGTGSGLFDWPRGIAPDRDGNVLVVDTNNRRIQKFNPKGEFLAAFGSEGSEPGKFREPSSIAVDDKGDIFVADFLNRRIQKLKSDGSALEQWNGPDAEFAPRDVAVGSDKMLYAADEAKARIVKFDRSGTVVGSWGTKGGSGGQFDQITSVAVDDKSDRVFAADPRQGRIVVFDRKGNFIANWLVAEWQKVENGWYLHDIAVDSDRKRVYATSTQTDEVIVFDLAGNRLASLKPTPPDKLEGASSIAVFKNKLFVVSTFPGRVSVIEIVEQPAASPVR